MTAVKLPIHTPWRRVADTTMVDSSLYETDFAAWASQQARLLRDGPRNDLDWDHLAEEIDSLGRAERRALTSQLARLIAHLLKGDHQPERRGRRWVLSIENAQRQATRLLDDNPSLKHHLPTVLEDAWDDGRNLALRETDLDPRTLPRDLPWPFEEIMAQGSPDGSVTWD